ncbi:hypothetical protein L1987_74173 [Smallanthus sonchifolius]|uniref:Uncharacterized protein n=1 Tax=Smallanthus sonchifolius TaxID=185202 RepID=A0ACB9A1A1_9ASTR|nr:hypothetical protein L1987_74173 [Smallanthus sonchifolius]
MDMDGELNEGPHDKDEEIEVAEIDPLLGHPYLQFNTRSTTHRRCQRLRRMRIDEHAAIDWLIREDLGEADKAQEIIGHNTPWDRLFESAFLPSFREPVVEFISFFTFSARPTD